MRPVVVEARVRVCVELRVRMGARIEVRVEVALRDPKGGSLFERFKS